jgi:hypothetical protein
VNRTLIDPSTSRNYYKRREGFVKAKENASSRILRDALSDAVAHTDVCGEIFVQLLVPALRSYVARVKDDCDRALNQERIIVEDSVAKMQKAEQEGDVETVRSLIETSRRNKHELECARDELLRSAEIGKEFENRVKELFEKIFAEDGSDHSAEAVLDLIDYLVGLMPIVGDIVSGVEKIRAILTRTKTEVANAGKYLVEIERFLDASYSWALVSYQIARNLNVVSGKRISLERGSDDVVEMFHKKGASMVWRPPLLMTENPGTHQI